MCITAGSAAHPAQGHIERPGAEDEEAEDAPRAQPVERLEEDLFPGPSTNSIVFHTSVLLTWSRWGPGVSSHENESPHNSVDTCLPSIQTISWRAL